MTFLKGVLRHTQTNVYPISPNNLARLWFCLTLIILLSLWWQGGLWFRSQLIAEQSVQVSEEVALHGSALSAAINRRFALLRGLHAFVRTEYHQENFGPQFMIYAANLYNNTPGLNNFVLAPNGVIHYIYPSEGNEKILGYDMLHAFSFDLQEDVQLALETEEIILGFPLDYAQEKWGIAARKAVYLDDGTFWGLVSIIIDIPTLLSEAGLDVESPNLDFRLVDRSDEVIFETRPVQGKTGVTYNLGLPEEPWELTGYPKEDWNIIILPDLLPILISGFLIVLLLSCLVYMIVNRQVLLERAVQQRTNEIAQINRSLEERVTARTRELTTLLEVSQNVTTIPDLQPLLTLILDRIQEIITCVGAYIFLVEDAQHLALLIHRGSVFKGDLPTLWPLDTAQHFMEIIRSRKPLIIPDVRADTPLANAWRKTIVEQIGEAPDRVRCWLGVPLMVKERVIGLFVFHHEEANFYTKEQGTYVLAFAYQAALAIENARLYEQAQHIAVLRERQRLARELHDSVSQALYSIALNTRAAQKIIDRNLNGVSKKDILEPIDHVLAMAEAGLAEMRSLIFELHPESLTREGLIAALIKQTMAIQVRYGLDLRVNLCEEPDLSVENKLHIYRFVQEALHNVVKHAQASKVMVKICCKDNWISLIIQDNGLGFDTKIQSQGLGLLSMQERISQVNGIFKVKSKHGEGTIISAQIPLN